jgi:hypothetical protein
MKSQQCKVNNFSTLQLFFLLPELFNWYNFHLNQSIEFTSGLYSLFSMLFLKGFVIKFYVQRANNT